MTRLWGLARFFVLAVAVSCLGLATLSQAAESDSKSTANANASSSSLPTIRMRAGSKNSFKDADGNTWLPDATTADGGFEGGSMIDRPDEMEIKNTKNPGLYHSEHYNMDSFNYKLPNGKYNVKLHFAETYHGINATGERVFTFKIQDQEFKDFDVFKKAGGSQRAYVESIPVEVNDGKLKIKFTAGVNNPEINGIEIIPAGQAMIAEKASTLPTIRIRAGSTKPYTDSQGNAWQADVETKAGGFDGGESSDRAEDMQIKNTKDPGLYRSEHWGMDSFSYQLPNGKYIVKLHFAETWEGISGPGERLFSFTVQGKEFKDFDVWQKAGGPQKAYVESVPVNVTDGKLKITFTANVDNPEINGIEIIPAE